MRTFILRLLSFSMMTALMLYTSTPTAAQKRQVVPQAQTVTNSDGDQVQVVGGHLYAPKPWEPTDTTPNFDNLFAPQIAPVFGAWTSIGPGPLASGGTNVSGRITGIAAHPTDANTIYITAAGGGVWKTTNGGTAWTALTDTQRSLSMGCIAISKTNPSHLYAGTGEANNSGDSNFGRGFLVSTDAGVTWTLRTGPGGTFNTNRMACSQVAVDLTNENVAYAAMSNFGENGVFAGGITGVYKTTDGGTTWTNVTAANGKEASAPWSDVAIDPNNPAIVYGAVGYLFGSANNGVYKSTDSGATWTLLNAANAPVGASFGRLSLAISSANSANVLYAAAENNTSVNSALGSFVRSDNAGASFSVLTASNYMGGQGWYDQDLAVDPASSAIAYATGAANANSVLRTITSGTIFTDIHTGGSSPHVDHHATAFDANGKLLDGDDGGIWRLEATTPAVSWTDLNGNLSTIQFEGIGLHPTNSQIVVGGSQDNGTEKYTGTATWASTDGGDGGPAKFSSTNGTRVYHQIPVGSAGNGNFFRRSDDTGSSWATKTTGMSGDNTQNFYAPYSVSPVNGDRVLYGATNVWETVNGGDLWTSIAAPGVNGFAASGNVDAIGIAASNANTLYASTGGTFASSSTIFITLNHGTTWIEHDLPASSGRVNEIQVDPTNDQIAYAVTNTFSTGGNVFKTINGGGTWTNITGNLATVTACTCALPVWSLQIDSIASKLYIGADDGVYVSLNGGTTWARYGTGFPNVQVFQIELNQTLHILGAATHGRGAWEILTQSLTAADVSVSGRVLTSAGSGIRGATVTMTGADGIVRRAMTNAFGYYSFEDVPSGGAYTFTAASRGFNFSPRIINLNDAVSDLDLIGSH